MTTTRSNDPNDLGRREAIIHFMRELGDVDMSYVSDTTARSYDLTDLGHIWQYGDCDYTIATSRREAIKYFKGELGVIDVSLVSDYGYGIGTKSEPISSFFYGEADESIHTDDDGDIRVPDAENYLEARKRVEAELAEGVRERRIFCENKPESPANKVIAQEFIDSLTLHASVGEEEEVEDWDDFWLGYKAPTIMTFLE